MLTEYHNILFPKAGHACLVSSKPEHVGTPIALYLTCSPDNPPNSLDYTVQAILYVSDEYLDRYEGNTTAVRATIYPVICHQQGVMRADYCRQSSLIQNQLDTCREGSGTYSYFSFHSPDIRATMPWKDKDASAPLRIDFSIDVPTAGQAVLNINLGQWTIEDNMARAWESVETNDKLACGFGDLGLAMASRLRSYAAAIRMQRLGKL